MKLLIAALLLFSNIAFAKVETISNSISNGTSAASDNRIIFKLVPYVSSMGFGGSFETLKSNRFGWGGNLMILPENDEPGEVSAGLMTFGGNIFLHYPIEFVDFYFSPGVNVMMMEIGSEEETKLGVTYALGAVAQITPGFGVGLEIINYYPLFSKMFHTTARAYYDNAAITGRISF